MQVCVAGWYYCKECLEPLSTRTGVQVVAHREGDALSIPCVVIANEGLEFNCYDYFVKKLWDRKSDVLFCHDDIKINDVTFLDDLEKEQGDIIMVWHSDAHRKRNLAHGRMFKCSVAFLTKRGGFWWDKNNKGTVTAGQGANSGISVLYESIKHIQKHFYTDKVHMAYRGNL